MDNIVRNARWAVVDVEVGLGDQKVHDIGADDQNIFEFRSSDSKFLYQLSQEPDS